MESSGGAPGSSRARNGFGGVDNDSRDELEGEEVCGAGDGSQDNKGSTGTGTAGASTSGKGLGVGGLSGLKGLAARKLRKLAESTASHISRSVGQWVTQDVCCYTRP
jgi:hypothetical protein